MIITPRLSIIFFGMNGKLTHIPLMRLAQRHKIIGLVESQRRKGSKVGKLQLSISKILLSIFNIVNPYSLYRFSRRHNLPYFLLEEHNMGQLHDFILKLNPNLICVSSFSKLIPDKILSIPDMGCINLHPSLLPNYRGPNPEFWQFHEMESKSGATVHFIDSGEDTGDVLGQVDFLIKIGQTHEEFVDIAANSGAGLLTQVIDDIARNDVQPRSQKARSNLIRARKIDDKSERLIDWDRWSCKRIFHFLSGTHHELNSPRLRKNCLSIFSNNIIGYRQGRIERKQNGEIYKISKNILGVKCKDGIVILRRRIKLRDILKHAIS